MEEEKQVKKKHKLVVPEHSYKVGDIIKCGEEHSHRSIHFIKIVALKKDTKAPYAVLLKPTTLESGSTPADSYEVIKPGEEWENTKKALCRYSTVDEQWTVIFNVFVPHYNPQHKKTKLILHKLYDENKTYTEYHYY